MIACAREGCLSLGRSVCLNAHLDMRSMAVICVILRASAFRAQGLLATCCQHALDHNNGSLIIDA